MYASHSYTICFKTLRIGFLIKEELLSAFAIFDPSPMSSLKTRRKHLFIEFQENLEILASHCVVAPMNAEELHKEWESFSLTANSM